MTKVLFSPVLPGVNPKPMGAALAAACPEARLHLDAVTPLKVSGSGSVGAYDPLIGIWTEIMAGGAHLVHGKSALDLAHCFPKSAVVMVLGDPLWRAMESFRNVRKSADHPLHAEVEAQGFTTAREFYRSPVSVPLRNRQCRKLARIAEGQELPPDRLFERARSLVEAMVVWIGFEGITSGPQPVLGKVIRDLGVGSGTPDLVPFSPPKAVPDPETAETIREANSADHRLWEFARERMGNP